MICFSLRFFSFSHYPRLPVWSWKIATQTWGELRFSTFEMHFYVSIRSCLQLLSFSGWHCAGFAGCSILKSFKCGKVWLMIRYICLKFIPPLVQIFWTNIWIREKLSLFEWGGWFKRNDHPVLQRIPLLSLSTMSPFRSFSRHFSFRGRWVFEIKFEWFKFPLPVGGAAHLWCSAMKINFPFSAMFIILLNVQQEWETDGFVLVVILVSFDLTVSRGLSWSIHNSPDLSSALCCSNWV